MDVRETILQVAESIILRRGFNAFRYKDVAEKINISKTGIRYYFPNKEDIGKAVIQQSRLAFLEWSKQIDRANLDAVDKLDAFFTSYRALLMDGDKICIAGILGAELNTLSLVMQNELRFYYLERKKWLQQLLSDGQYSGSFFFTITPKEEALFILASLQGGLQIARINEDHDIFFAICRQLKTQLIDKQEAVMFKS